jgi:hypothetical protein
VAVVGCLILAASYLGIGLSLLVGHSGEALLITLLGFGGLGLGRNLVVAHMTSSVPDRYAADLSGLINTDSQIFGVAGVAIFGTLYLSLTPEPGPGPAMWAFTIVNAAFALTALLAAAATSRLIRRPTPSALVVGRVGAWPTGRSARTGA